VNRRTKIILGAVAFSLVALISVYSILPNNKSVVELPATNEFSTVNKPFNAVEVSTENTSSPAGEIVQLKNVVVVEVYRPVGGTMVQVYHHESSNVITNVGLYTLARYIAG